MAGKIKIPQCPKCGAESEHGYCHKCRQRCEIVTRDKRQVTGEFAVVNWFSSRSSAGLIVEDAEGKRYPLYMSDVFEYLGLRGITLGNCTLEETKKGSAYAWKVITEEAV